MIKIIQNRKIYFIISGILMLASIIALSVWGLNLGIDFTGGSLLEVQVQNEHLDYTAQDITDIITTSVYEIGEVHTQPTQGGFLIRMQELSEQRHQAVISVLEGPTKISDGLKDKFRRSVENGGGLTDEEVLALAKSEVVEKRFESIGPVIGQELKDKALWAIATALVIIVLFIAWSFRKVSKPVQSWKYGIGAILALTHDVLITTGVFAVLGHFFGMEVGILFVTALLTILGYSVNDTIVVYDRARENLIYNPQDTFEDTINKSVNETIGRSVNTSLTTLLVLFALYFLGGASIRDFVLTLILGVLLGTYSSIFIASPLLVVWQKLSRKK